MLQDGLYLGFQLRDRLTCDTPCVLAAISLHTIPLLDSANMRQGNGMGISYRISFRWMSLECEITPVRDQPPDQWEADFDAKPVAVALEPLLGLDRG